MPSASTAISKWLYFGSINNTNVNTFSFNSNTGGGGGGGFGGGGFGGGGRGNAARGGTKYRQPDNNSKWYHGCAFNRRKFSRSMGENIVGIWQLQRC